jgi:hypothetical protein
MNITITIVSIVLVLYLLFKNTNILVIGGIVVLLSYYFNYKEGAKNKNALITAQTLKMKAAPIIKTVASKPKKK